MRRYLVGLISVIALSALGISCSKEKSLELGVPSQPGSGGSANYALSTNGPNCMNAVVSGVYKKGTATNTSNSVDIEVNVNTIGTWTMNSAGVAGFYFQGAGTFANTGTQTITLMAAGTPNMAGPQTFTLVTGTTTCAFVVTVENDSTPTNPPPPSTGEYFPMTQGSWWSYDDGTGDTLKTTVSGTTVIAGKTYSNFVDSYEGIPDTDTSFYRKDNSTGFFYLNEDLSVLAAIGITMSQPRADVLFMKNSLTTGATWNSDHAGTASGIPVTVRFKFDVVNANATTTIGSNTFTNVYQVQLTLQLGMLGTFTDMAAPAILSFAKGVGLIRTDDGTSSTDIRYWHVN